MTCKLAVLSINTSNKSKGTVLEAFDVDKSFGLEVERKESIFTIVTITDCDKGDDAILSLLAGERRLNLPITDDVTTNLSELSLING